MYKAKVYGVYLTGRAGDGEEIPFEIEGNIGDIPNESWAKSLIKGRFIKEWLLNSEDYKKRVQVISEIHIDELKKINDDDGVTGKDILTMDWDTLRLLACKYPEQMLSLPLKNKVALKVAQEKAANLYLDKIKKINLEDITDIYKFDLASGTHYFDWEGKEVIAEDIDEIVLEDNKKTLAQHLGAAKKAEEKKRRGRPPKTAGSVIS